MTEPKLPLALTLEERRSPLWRKLLAHFEEQLDTLRQQNDADLGENVTARLRGRIQQVKVFIDLNKPPREVED